MKSNDFATCLAAFRNLSKTLCPSSGVEELEKLTSMFFESENRTVLALTKISISFSPVQVQKDNTECLRILEVLEAYRKFVEVTGPTGLAKDLTLVSSFIEKHSTLSIAELIDQWSTALNTRLDTSESFIEEQASIQKLIERVEKSYRDQVKFGLLNADLKKARNKGGYSDNILRAVASHFWTSVNASTKRAEALRLIRKLNSDFITGQRRDEAAAVRSAA